MKSTCITANLPLRTLLLALGVLFAVALDSRAELQTTFHPGQVWPDNAGNPVESHLGGALYENGTYYWYGMNFAGGTTLPPGTVGNGFSWMDNRGMSIYSSTDLYNWTARGVTLQSDPRIQPYDMLIRPKVIKNDTTGKYVMMAQLCSADWYRNDVIVATSDSPVGPFAVNSVFTPPGGAFDITLYKDDDGKAYLVTGHEWIKISRLNSDYLSIEGTATVTGVAGEAPAIFKSHGSYYMLTSNLTAWAPNPNKYSVAPTLYGPWTPKGTFATGAGSADTFASQTTFVLPVAGREDSFIYMADRTGAISQTTIPDLDAMKHVWLPITLDSTAKTIEVPWRDQWDLSVFPAQTPEPSSLVALGTSLFVLAWSTWRRRRRSQVLFVDR
jgi:hypothetical protein